MYSNASGSEEFNFKFYDASEDAVSDLPETYVFVADEPLGLRPEMTASIARAACTRLAEKPRPLRLWAAGTVFESKVSLPILSKGFGFWSVSGRSRIP